MPAKIVRLTDKLSVASQIDDADIAAIAAQGYRAIINNRPDGEEPSQLVSTGAKRQAESAGLSYHYLPFTAATLTDADIATFDRLMAELDGPVLAHCRSGTRCYLIWAATQARKGNASADTLIREAAGRGFDISALTRFV